VMETRARTTRGRRSRRTLLRGAAFAVVAAASVLGLLAAGCGSSSKQAEEASSDGTDVNVQITPQGCPGAPGSVTAGTVNFNVANKSAPKVFEVELRTQDFSHILGEQENLTPGLSGGFSVTMQPGTYTLYCPGASHPKTDFTVTGTQTGPDWKSVPRLVAAVAGYQTYVKQQVAGLVTATTPFCAAIDAGNASQARLLYSRARLYYERIEPVASIWGALDTEIDGRLNNPVTDPAEFHGFHKIEQLLFQQHTLTGATAQCVGLLANEKQLQTLVASATYNPLEMAAGATDLIGEAAKSKITGEEERYSNVDLATLQANIEGAHEVSTLLKPYLQTKDPGLAATIQQRYGSTQTALDPYQATPGYLNTGYVDYATVTPDQRRVLSSAINAYDEALSNLSTTVGS
jgi:iron uptake system component EfeO